jgi:hypothetical protein
MNRSAAFPLLAALLLVLPACDRDRPDVDFGGRDLGPELFSVVSRDDAIKVSLTDDYLVFSLTEQVRESARADVARDMEGERGRAAQVALGVLGKTVDRALAFRARYALDEIEDIRWEDGEMRVVFTDRRRQLPESFQVEGEPVTRAFDEDAVLDLADEFHHLKRERSTRRR